MSALVAIVGRPNVGKSTLFNRLAGRRVALVDDTPGVTRDRRESAARLGDLTFTIIDTAGLEEVRPESLAGRMRAQTEAAIADADAVLFLIDARAGIVPDDRVFANVLHRAGKPTILVANKAEGRSGSAGAYEAFDLGLGEPVAISAEHGEGLAELYDALRAALPAQTAPPSGDEDDDTGPAAPVPEKPIRFAVVVILLIDATVAFEEQDLRIADLIEREGRALVLGINKWDLKEAAPGAIAKLHEQADRLLAQVKGVPVVAVSGLTGAGLDHLMKAVTAIHALWNKRIPTNALNRWLDGVLAAHPPPAVSGRRLKLNYITQPKTRPPSFVLFCTRADAVPDSYQRYLVNALREAFGLPGVPIRLTLREKANPYAGRKAPQGR